MNQSPVVDPAASLRVWSPTGTAWVSRCTHNTDHATSRNATYSNANVSPPTVCWQGKKTLEAASTQRSCRCWTQRTASSATVQHVR
jgi:hypothetical protein